MVENVTLIGTMVGTMMSVKIPMLETSRSRGANHVGVVHHLDLDCL